LTEWAISGYNERVCKATANDGEVGSGKGRLPKWLKRPLPKGEKFERVMRLLGELRLETVCNRAACPNRGECYSQGTATFMIMGSICTRNCEFCAVAHGVAEPVSADEPQRVAQAVHALGLKHVVITSVTRDDLPDGGAAHFAHTIHAVRETNEQTTIEVLTPDFQGDQQCLDTVCAARPDVFNHNLETTRRLTGEIRSGADYDRSLAVLDYVGRRQNRPIVKSGFMLGLGEHEPEILEMLQDLRAAGVEMVTIGQYLQPGKANRPVTEFYPPEQFDRIRQMAEAMGFSHVAAGPFVRSSYHADINLQQTNSTEHCPNVANDP